MPVPNTFANATATIPLTQLDANFATTITLGNTAIQLGNTVTTLNNMTLANVNISSGIVTITNASVTTANVTTANIATAIIANVTVSGTGTFAAGSNTAPSITTSGDTNTGIFFPAADTIAFSEGGVERMRLDSAGNVGIGGTPAKLLDLAANNTGITTGDPLNTLRFSDTDTTSAAGQPMGRIEWYSADTDTAGVKAYIQAQATDGSPDADMVFATNHVSGGGTAERMRIQYDGNVGIGTSTPAYALEVKRTGSISQIAATSDTTAAYSYARYNSGATNVVTGIISDPTTGYISVETNHPLVLRTNATERMRIQADGNTAIGTTSPVVGNSLLTVATGITAASSTSAVLQVYNSSAGTNLKYFRLGMGISGAAVFERVNDAYTAPTEVVRFDTSNFTQFTANNVLLYQGAPTSKAAAATLSGAELVTGILNTTGTTYTITLPTGTNIEGALTWAGNNVCLDWFVINTASGTITIGANGNTTLGALTIATGTSAHFRIRRTAANTFTVYRL